MLMGCLSASKEEKLLTGKLCINPEVERRHEIPAERRACAQHMDPSLFTVCPKLPRGQDQDEDQTGLQNPVGTCCLCDTS